MLVVAKLSSIGSSPARPGPTFGYSGLIKLVGGSRSGQCNGLCGVTTAGKASAATDCGSGGSWLPATARPTGTPVAVLRSDGTGFQLFTTWYDPPTANWDNCPAERDQRQQLHHCARVPVRRTGTWAQIYGMQIPHQYVTGVQFVGTTLFITYGDGTAPQTANRGQLQPNLRHRRTSR